MSRITVENCAGTIPRYGYTKLKQRTGNYIVHFSREDARGYVFTGQLNEFQRTNVGEVKEEEGAKSIRC